MIRRPWLMTALLAALSCGACGIGPVIEGRVSTPDGRLPNVLVCKSDGALTPLAITKTDAEGAYSLWLPMGRELSARTFLQASAHAVCHAIGTAGTLTALAVDPATDITPLSELVSRAISGANNDAVTREQVLAIYDLLATQLALTPIDTGSTETMIAQMSQQVAGLLSAVTEALAAPATELSGSYSVVLLSAGGAPTLRRESMAGTATIDSEARRIRFELDFRTHDLAEECSDCARSLVAVKRTGSIEFSGGFVPAGGGLMFVVWSGGVTLGGVSEDGATLLLPVLGDEGATGLALLAKARDDATTVEAVGSYRYRSLHMQLALSAGPGWESHAVIAGAGDVRLFPNGTIFGGGVDSQMSQVVYCAGSAPVCGATASGLHSLTVPTNLGGTLMLQPSGAFTFGSAEPVNKGMLTQQMFAMTTPGVGLLAAVRRGVQNDLAGHDYFVVTLGEELSAGWDASHLFTGHLRFAADGTAQLGGADRYTRRMVSCASCEPVFEHGAQALATEQTASLVTPGTLMLEAPAMMRVVASVDGSVLLVDQDQSGVRTLPEEAPRSTRLLGFGLRLPARSEAR